MFGSLKSYMFQWFSSIFARGIVYKYIFCCYSQIYIRVKCDNEVLRIESYCGYILHTPIVTEQSYIELLFYLDAGVSTR